jgi:hypothetical protein
VEVLQSISLLGFAGLCHPDSRHQGAQHSEYNPPIAGLGYHGVICDGFKNVGMAIEKPITRTGVTGGLAACGVRIVQVYDKVIGSIASIWNARKVGISGELNRDRVSRSDVGPAIVFPSIYNEITTREKWTG